MKNDDVRLMFYPEDKQYSKAEDRAYLRNSLVFNVTEDILVAMEDLNLSRADLAKMMSKSKSFVTQVLSGERNMTLGTLSDICFAMGIEPIVRVCAPGSEYFVPNSGPKSAVTSIDHAKKVLLKERAYKSNPAWVEGLVAENKMCMGMNK